MTVPFRPRKVAKRPTHSAARPELAPAFQTWIAQNLLSGVAPPALVSELVRSNVSRPLAARAVAELAGHPLLTGAREIARDARRLSLVQRLLTLQASLAANPSAIERRSLPAADEFFDRYLATSTPVVFTDLVTRWQAFESWSPAAFKQRFGNALLSMTDGRESDPLYDARTEVHTRPITMADFVDRVLASGASNDFYMVAKNRNIRQPELAPLFDEIWLPEGWFEAHALSGSSALWFGPAGTVTPLHYDSSSILFCQVFGRKQLIMASPLEVGLLEGAHHMYSAVDPERANHPGRGQVTFKRIVLEPGEALFIPAGWWHHVRALDVSISLAVNHFARPNNYDAWYQPGDVM